MVTLTINGKTVCVPEGTSILDAARAANIDIPTLCYLKDLNEIGACRICMVEVEGQETLVAACDNEVHAGMVIHTNSQKVRMTRRVNLQLLLSQHEVNCVKCTRSGNCKLQKLANDYNLLGAPYQKKLRPAPVDYSAPILRFENRCVKCMRCVQVCDKVQGVHIWDLVGTGSRTTVGAAKADSLSQSLCTYCGQCVTHCPVGALEERDDTDHVYRMLADPTLTTVVQVAPAVRTAWTEYFGLSPEQAAPGVLASALRELGFDYVFDTNFGADLTIMEEGSEFIERFTHRDVYSWPMFTSCCPGWVRFVKGQFPQFAKNLSTAKSPQQMFGAVAKSYFAEKIGVDPKNLRVISVMPCTSKKAEAALPTMKDACGGPDVDVVITTRELVRMLRCSMIDPASLEESSFDSPLGSGTGAAVIFGVTGGVMDAALRSAYYLVTGENPDPDAFTAVRGIQGWKEASFDIPGAGTVRTAVVSGLGNTRELMEAIAARWTMISWKSWPAPVAAQAAAASRFTTARSAPRRAGMSCGDLTTRCPFVSRMKTPMCRRFTKSISESRCPNVLTICCIPISKPGRCRRSFDWRCFQGHSTNTNMRDKLALSRMFYVGITASATAQISSVRSWPLSHFSFSFCASLLHAEHTFC